MTPVYQKQDAGSYRPVCPTSVPGSVMEQITLNVTMCHIRGSRVIRCSHQGFMKGGSYLINLIYDKVTHLVVEGKVMDFVYLDISKAFDTISHGIPWRNWLLTA